MIKVITKSSPFLHQDISVSVIMLKVLMALCPGILAMIYYLGWGVLINICLAIVVAVTAESLVMILRKRSITDTVTDYSAVITAVLLAIALPAYAPWWITVVGILFAIIIGKQLYGGLGYNPFNPAMLGYVALLISFPREMTQFVSPNEFSANINFVESFKLIFEVNNFPVDAFTMATPIDHLKTNLRLDHSMEAILQHSIYGIFGGTGWEIINACFFIGGLWLIYEKIISWHIPVTVLLSIAFIATLFYWFNDEKYATPLFHLTSGATIMAAFFIVTDPVNSASSYIGKLLIGCGVGLLTYIIRTWGGYPDGVAFAVLLMNMTVPVINYYIKPKVFGYDN